MGRLLADAGFPISFTKPRIENDEVQLKEQLTNTKVYLFASF